MVSTTIDRQFIKREEIENISSSKTSWNFLVVLYLIALLIPISINIGGLNITPIRLYLMPMIIYLLWGLLGGKYGKLLPVDFFFFFHVFWILVAMGINSPERAVSQFGSVGVEFLGGYLLGRSFIRTPEAFVALCRWIIFLVVCTVPFALWESTTGQPVLINALNKIPGFNPASIPVSEPRLGFSRAQVLFDHPIHYGLFCSVAMSLAFVALKDHSSSIRRYISSFSVMVGGFFALSSGALLAIILQLFLIFWATVFAKITWRWWLLFGLACCAYIAIDILANRSPVIAVLSRLAFSTHNLYIRTIIFDFGMDNVWSNPIFGLGLGDWVRPHWLPPSIDNFWLIMAIRYGIPGFLFLTAGYTYGLFKIMARNFETDRSLLNFRRAWVFTFIGLSFTLATVHVWTSLYSFVFFMFGAGMWFIKTVPQSEKSIKANDISQKERQSLPYTRFSKFSNRVVS